MTTRLLFIVALALFLLTLSACGGPAAASTQALTGSQPAGNTARAPAARTSKVRGLLDQTLGQGKDYITKVSARLHEVNVSDLVNPPKPAATPAANRQLTAAPASMGTANPSSSCQPAAQYVADVNLDDQNMAAPPPMQPNHAFTKIWRVKNTGKCAWKPTYKLAYTNGNVPAALMKGKPRTIGQPVNVNSTFDIKLDLTSPSQPGVYQGFWQMQDDAGVPFGEPVYVGIRVPGLAAPAAGGALAPQPVSAPVPGAPVPASAPAVAPTPASPSAFNFSADRTSIKIGEAVVFSWNAQGVYGVYFYEDGQPWQEGGVPGTGSRKVSPPETTVYVLRVLKSDYTVQEQRIQITVADAPGVPVIAVFTVNPGQIQPGQCVAINWEVQGETNFVRLWINDVVRLNNAPARGYLRDCPDATTGVQYKLEAGGPNGINRRTRRVIISGDPVNGLSIDAFSASSDRIRPGQCVDLTWAISGGQPDTLILYRNDEQFLLDPAGSRYTDCPPAGRLVSYELVAGLNLEQAQRLFSVEVVDVTQR